jgi:hypothetical protein
VSEDSGSFGRGYVRVEEPLEHLARGLEPSNRESL